MVGLATDAARSGETAPAWLNAANEEAVAAFLAGRLPWVGIAAVLAEAMARWDGTPARSLDDVLDVDRRARATARQVIDQVIEKEAP